MEDFNYFLVFGLGCLWLGSQIIWVAGLPRQLQSGEKKTAEKGSPQAFMLFWFDQYAWIGILLCISGAISSILGAVS